MKMGNKYLYLARMVYSPTRAAILKKYVSTIFDLEDVKENDIIVYFCNRRSNYAFANIFDNGMFILIVVELECFESAKDIFVKFVHEGSEKKAKSVVDIE